MEIYRAGPDPAQFALVLVHGRGGSARDMLNLWPQLELPGLTALAPQAPGFSWYPQSFLAPLESNQPYLDRALNTLETLVESLGLPSRQIMLLGFSQGACLTLEFVARQPRRYGAVMALTGGLIRPEAGAASLAGTRILLASGEPDPHVPWARVQASAKVLQSMGGRVELRHYPGRPHMISPDELAHCRGLIASVIESSKEKL